MKLRLRPPAPVCDDAEFSNNGLERLWLSRKVADGGPVGLIIGLNPSTAGATETDHTITKEKEFTRRWGWSGFWKANLFTVIETHSAKLKNLSFESAVGEHGSVVLERMIPCVNDIVVCWGVNVPKPHRHRIGTVCSIIRELKAPDAMVWCFGLSNSGDPVHPLMLSYRTKLRPYELPAPRASRRDDV
jgi:hypothetical protein